MLFQRPSFIAPELKKDWPADGPELLRILSNYFRLAIVGVPDAVSIRKSTSAPKTLIDAEYGAYVPGGFEIKTGHVVEIASGAVLEIG